MSLNGSLLLSLAITSILAACKSAEKTPPAPPPPDVQAEIDTFREEGKILLKTQMELQWKNWVFGDEIDIASTYKGHEKLFSLDAIRLADRAIAGAKDEDRKHALRYFKEYLLWEYINKTIAPVTDGIQNSEAAAKITVAGKEYSYREAGRLIADEKDRSRRREISDACVPVLKEMNKLYEEKEKTTARLVAELGYSSYNALGSAIREVDLDAVGKMAEQALAETEELFRREMEKQSPAVLGCKFAEMRRPDQARFVKLPGYEKYFPADTMIETVKKTLAGMGVNLDEQKNILLHTEALPKKNPRAVCFNIEVPGDVRLSIKPIGGPSDYENLFHEMGHGQHFANTKEATFEFKQLGPNVVTETYAFLFGGLRENPAWLAQFTAMKGKDLDKYARFAALVKLYFVRRYAAKVLFELEWHSGRAADPLKGYQATLARAYGYPLDENDALRYLADHDDFFYSADYLRAWFLEAQLSKHLSEKFGEKWFGNAQAGDFLKGLWAKGQKPSPVEVAKSMGYEGVSPEPLIERLKDVLK